MNQSPIDISKPTNLVYNEVKRKLEDKKTNWFIMLTAINVFLWGLFLAEYRELNRNYETLQDKHDLTQLMIYELKDNKNE
jgi:hypothetical protein